MRIRPNELHIFDWDAYRTYINVTLLGEELKPELCHRVFKAGSDFNRAPEFYNAPQVDGCFRNISDGRVAKPSPKLKSMASNRSSTKRYPSSQID